MCRWSLSASCTKQEWDGTGERSTRMLDVAEKDDNVEDYQDLTVGLLTAGGGQSNSKHRVSYKGG